MDEIDLIIEQFKKISKDLGLNLPDEYYRQVVDFVELRETFIKTANNPESNYLYLTDKIFGLLSFEQRQRLVSDLKKEVEDL